jgi:hypothetical protein
VTPHEPSFFEQHQTAILITSLVLAAIVFGSIVLRQRSRS